MEAEGDKSFMGAFGGLEAGTHDMSYASCDEAYGIRLKDLRGITLIRRDATHNPHHEGDKTIDTLLTSIALAITPWWRVCLFMPCLLSLKQECINTKRSPLQLSSAQCGSLCSSRTPSKRPRRGIEHLKQKVSPTTNPVHPSPVPHLVMSLIVSPCLIASHLW